jgi:hypothetical protein
VAHWWTSRWRSNRSRSGCSRLSARTQRYRPVKTARFWRTAIIA